MNNILSVIICTYNRAHFLKDTLASLLEQKADGNFIHEVIVVDNNSSDATRAVVESFFPRFNVASPRLKYLFQSAQGKSGAVNKAIEAAKGDIIVFTDDDVTFDQRWLSTIVKCFEQHSCDGVGGRVLPVYAPGTPEWIKAGAVKLSGTVVIYDYGTKTCAYDKSMYPFIGANFAFRRKVFTDCGMFRTDLGPGQGTVGEDHEFIVRLVKKSKVLYYCGDALVWHPVDLQRLTFKHVAQWNIALGRFAARMEYESAEQPLVYLCGVPRYLWRGVIQDFLWLAVSVLSRPAFLDATRSFYRKVGMIKEYRQRASGGKSYA